MRERPILFQGAMVRALLRAVDPKTQTRRAWKISPPPGVNVAVSVNGKTRCPYGAVGDRLWVRETFFAFGRWITAYDAAKDRDAWHFIDMTVECGHAYSYQAGDSNPLPLRGRRDSGVTPGWWKRPAIFMPRAASRITLEVTEVRVERLQSISEADVLAEGIQRWPLGFRVEESGAPEHASRSFETAANAYRWLWDSINGKTHPWESNPWVWVVAFKRVTP